MNMISTGAFLTDVDASHKQDNLVSKLVSAWEKKNSKTARAGGVSLMALSLAACGSSDDENFKEFATEEAYNAVITGAKADATTAAEAAAKIAQDAAVAAVDKSTDDADAILAAVVAVDATATTVSEVATNAAAAVDKSTDDAAAITKAVSDGTSGAYTTVASLFAAYDAAANPAAVSAALTSSTDILTGTSSNDAFTGTTGTYAGTDVISDASTSDSDTLTLTVTDDIDITGSVVNIENVAINLNQFTNADFDVDVGGISAGTNVTLDVTQTGSGVVAASMDSVGSITITTSSDFTSLDLANNANADVTVVSQYTGTGRFTLTDSAGTGDTLVVTSSDDVSLDLAATNFDESITVTSANDIVLTNADAAVAVNLTSGDQVTVTTADAATSMTISAQGTGLSATGAASTATTISTLTGATALATLNVSGNGGDVRLDITGGATTNTLTTINATGANNVTVVMDAGDHDVLANKLDFNDNSTGTTKVVFDTVTDDQTLDTRTIGADEIEFSADFGADTMTVASGQHFIANSDQGSGSTFTAALASASTNSITYEVSDEITTTTGATGTDYDIDDITFTNFKTVNLIATDNFLNNTTAAASANIAAGTAKIVISGAGEFTNITGGLITASEIDGSAMTGVATMFLNGGNIAKVSTGSAGDTITLTAAAAAGFDLSTGAGGDTIAMAAIDTGIKVDGGDGTDTLTIISTLDLSGQTFDLTSVEIVDIDVSGDAASTLTVDSAQITGESFTVIATETATNDVLDVTITGSTVDLSGLTVESDDIGVTIDGATYTAVSAATVTGTNAVDTITINGGVGSTASGGALGDTITGGAGADTINGDGGGDTLNGAGGADNITGGEGADTITSGNGADTINLTETTAAVDTIVTSGGAAGTAISHDTVTGFAAGAGGDEVDIDFSNVEALATNLIVLDDGADQGGAGNAITSTVTAAFDMSNLTANTDVLVIGGGLTFSSSGAVADALESGGSVALTMNGTDTAGDIFMVLYSSGSNSHLAAIESNTAAGDNGTFAAGELVGNDVVTFVGISDATTFAATNFDFIA
jgi:hypothetical protein